MMHLPHRLIWSQLSRHKSKFGVQRCLHEMTPTQPPTAKPPAATQPPTVPSQPPVPPSHTGTKEVKEIQIPVPWGHISGKWWGSTEVRPLLGLHGWQDNAGTWDRLAPLLPPDVSLLAMDFPGHGLSSHFHPGRSYHFVEYVSFVRRVATHFGWEKVSLLGHSLGSITAFVYACVYPETVDKYVGVDAMKPYSYNPVKSVRSSGRAVDAFIAATRLDPASTPSHTYADARSRLVRATSGSVGDDVADHLLSRGLAKMPDGRYRFTRDPRLKIAQLTNWTHDTILELASGIACDVCLINARPGLVYDKPEKHQDVYNVVQKAAKSFELHTVDGTHHLHLTNPKAILPIVLGFLKKEAA